MGLTRLLRTPLSWLRRLVVSRLAIWPSNVVESKRPGTSAETAAERFLAVVWWCPAAGLATSLGDGGVAGSEESAFCTTGTAAVRGWGEGLAITLFPGLLAGLGAVDGTELLGGLGVILASTEGLGLRSGCDGFSGCGGFAALVCGVGEVFATAGGWGTERGFEMGFCRGRAVVGVGGVGVVDAVVSGWA